MYKLWIYVVMHVILKQLMPKHIVLYLLMENMIEIIGICGLMYCIGKFMELGGNILWEKF